MARTRGAIAGEVLGGEEMVLEEEEEECFVRQRLPAVGVVMMWLASRAFEATLETQKSSPPFSAPCESPKSRRVRRVSWSTATPG
jgi:hypothetical protein